MFGDRNATISYIQNLQVTDGPQTVLGGFRPDANTNQSTVPATLAAVRVLKYLGLNTGDIPNLAQCRDFVGRCFDSSSGTILEYPEGPLTIYSTSVGALALVELEITPSDQGRSIVNYLAANAKSFGDVYFAAFAWEALSDQFPEIGLPDAARASWLKTLDEYNQGDGKYVDPTTPDEVTATTAEAVCAKIRLGAIDYSQHYDASDTFLRLSQNPDGGFGTSQASDIGTTYEVMRAFNLLKHVTSTPRPNPAWLSDPAAAVQFTADCRNTDGGYRISPSTPSLKSSAANNTYFAMFGLYFLNALPQ